MFAYHNVRLFNKTIKFNSCQSPVVIAPPHLSPDFIQYTVDPYGGVLTRMK